MSNFFTHLFSRSFEHEQAEPVVRPYVPSLFASRQAQDITPFFDAEQPGLAETVHSHGSSSPPQEDRRLSVSPGKRDTRSKSPNTAVDLPHGGQHAAGTMVRKTTSTKTEGMPFTAPAPSSPKQTTQPTPPPAAEVNRHWSLAADRPARQSITKTADSPPAPGFPGTGVPPAMDAPGEPALLMPSEQVPLTGAAVRPAQPEWLPKKQGQFSRQRLGRNEAAQPSIQVTIGRVEVRAVTPPAAPAKPTRPAPAPSLALSDYLKQRREGRR